MNRRQRGFTVIELLIVIVVIGILAGIVVTVWSTTGAYARDKARETDVRTWAATFDTYKSRFAVYPALPTADGTAGAQYLCLGSFSSTSNKCVQYGGSSTQYLDATATAAAAIATNVAKVGSTPINSGVAIKSKVVGPFVWLTQSTDGSATVTVTAKFINFFEQNCPSDFTDETSNSDTTLAALFSGISGTAKACSLTKTTTYNPNS